MNRPGRAGGAARPQKWELWWAYTLFSDASDVKLRPVIIVESRSDMIPAIELTSHVPRDWLVWQYPLLNWQGAGLSRPSTAVLSSISTIPREALGRRIGRLAYVDIMNIECMLEMLSGSPQPPRKTPERR